MHPFKGHRQGKKLSCGEKRDRFSPRFFAICILTIAAISLNPASVLHCTMHPSGLRSSTKLHSWFFPASEPENHRLLAVSNWFFHLSWLLTSLILAHGTGSKNANHDINRRDGFPITYMVLPQPIWVRRPSQPSSKTFLRHERNPVPHNIVGCSR